MDAISSMWNRFWNASSVTGPLTSAKTEYYSSTWLPPEIFIKSIQPYLDFLSLLALRNSCKDVYRMVFFPQIFYYFLYHIDRSLPWFKMQDTLLATFAYTMKKIDFSCVPYKYGSSNLREKIPSILSLCKNVEEIDFRRADLNGDTLRKCTFPPRLKKIALYYDDVTTNILLLFRLKIQELELTQSGENHCYNALSWNALNFDPRGEALGSMSSLRSLRVLKLFIKTKPLSVFELPSSLVSLHIETAVAIENLNKFFLSENLHNLKNMTCKNVEAWNKNINFFVRLKKGNPNILLDIHWRIEDLWNNGLDVWNGIYHQPVHSLAISSCCNVEGYPNKFDAFVQPYSEDLNQLTIEFNTYLYQREFLSSLWRLKSLETLTMDGLLSKTNVVFILNALPHLQFLTLKNGSLSFKDYAEGLQTCPGLRFFRLENTRKFVAQEIPGFKLLSYRATAGYCAALWRRKN